MIDCLKGLIVSTLILYALIVPNQAQAQAQINLTGNYLAPTEAGSSFSDGFWGGGATFRYFLNPNVAIGLNGRYFGRSESADFSGGSVKVSASFLIITGQAEYFLGDSESALRPYVGVEAGLYRASAKLSITGLGAGSESANNFGVAPKVGLQYAISPSLGINADAGYHLVFSDGELSKTLLVGAGVFFTFGQ